MGIAGYGKCAGQLFGDDPGRVEVSHQSLLPMLRDGKDEVDLQSLELTEPCLSEQAGERPDGDSRERPFGG